MSNNGSGGKIAAIIAAENDRLEAARKTPRETYEERLESHFADGRGDCPVDAMDGCSFCTLKRDEDGRLVLPEGMTLTLVEEDDTWSPVDLSGALNGTRELPKPTMLCRTDGSGCLLYPGKVHAFNAEPECGKTWLMLSASAQEMQEGSHVFYLDYESNDDEIVSRLLSLGVEASMVLAQFHYWNPQDVYESGVLKEYHTRWKPSLVVLDGMGSAMNVQGLSILDNDDATRFMDSYPRWFALQGASVAFTDHVVKRKEDRGGFGIGAQAKKSKSDVTYELQSLSPMGRGREGSTKIMVTKDRPGGVREVSENAKYFGVFHLRSYPGSEGEVEVWITPPPRGFAAVVDQSRPVEAMTLVSQFLESWKGERGPGATKVREGVSGDNTVVSLALLTLVNEGFVVDDGNNTRHAYRSVRPFS